MWEPINGTFFCGINRKIPIRSSNLEIMSYGFPKEEKNKMGKLKKNGLVHFRVHYCLPNDIVNLVFVNNFE
jgi:hypothetical protein